MMMTCALFFFVAFYLSIDAFSPSWRNPPIPDEEAFASLKAGMDSLPPGTKMFLNSGAYTKNSVTLYPCLF